MFRRTSATWVGGPGFLHLLFWWGASNKKHYLPSGHLWRTPWFCQWAAVACLMPSCNFTHVFVISKLLQHSVAGWVILVNKPPAVFLYAFCGFCSYRNRYVTFWGLRMNKHRASWFLDQLWFEGHLRWENSIDPHLLSRWLWYGSRLEDEQFLRVCRTCLSIVPSLSLLQSGRVCRHSSGPWAPHGISLPVAM